MLKKRTNVQLLAILFVLFLMIAGVKFLDHKYHYGHQEVNLSRLIEASSTDK